MPQAPSTLIAAILCSAAAGKNPWVPLGLLALAAAPESLPGYLLDPAVQGRLHSIAPSGVLWGVGAVLIGLAFLESLGDKVPGVEQWLVPLSAAWKPLAATIVASLLAWAGMPLPVAADGATAGLGVAGAVAPGLVTHDAQALSAVSVAALTVLLGSLAGYLATVGKVGARLLLSLIPVPGLKFAHSVVDDFFALFASGVGLALGDTTFVAALALGYLVVGLFAGPLLARLTGIYLRVLRAFVGLASPDSSPRPIPAWARERVADATAVRAYVLRAAGIGRARHGVLVFDAEGVRFLTRRLFFGVREWRAASDVLSRVGFAETATTRALLVSSRDEGGVAERVFYLFPTPADHVETALDAIRAGADLREVNPASESSRAGLPGYQRDDTRYRPAAVAGDLRLQAIVTFAAAIGVGVLTLGIYIPIGAGYVFSPFGRRFAFGTLLSIYLLLCAMGTGFVTLPVTIAYGVILNLIALRDLIRQAIRARTDGFVDKRAFLPLVARRVFVPPAGVRDVRDQELSPAVAVEAGWRSVASALKTTPAGA